MGPGSLANRASRGSTLPVSVRSDRKYPRSERKLNPEWLNSYWQTDLPYLTTMDEWRRYLEARRCYYKPSASLARLKELADRGARGLQSYEAHGYHMLRALAKDRGMGSQVRRRAKKQELIRCLEDADDWNVASKALPTFHRFFELPPELRNRIYTFYFDSLGKVPPRFVVPPLCRASRQLRLETTQLFFEHSTFIVFMRRVDGGQRHRHLARLHCQSEVARSNMPILKFAQIKHLYVKLKAYANRIPSATWTINLKDSRCVRMSPAQG
jgi:hypothetical protein